MKKLVYILACAALCVSCSDDPDYDSGSHSSLFEDGPLKVEQSTYRIDAGVGGSFVVTASQFCELSAYLLVPLNGSTMEEDWVPVSTDSDFHLQEKAESNEEESQESKSHTFSVDDLCTVTHRYSQYGSKLNEFVVTLQPQSFSYQLTLTLTSPNGQSAYAFVNAMNK